MKARQLLAEAFGHIGDFCLTIVFRLDTGCEEICADRNPISLPTIQDLPEDAFRQLAEDILGGKDLMVTMPRSLERRLKAMMHRMNGQLLANGLTAKGWDIFDPDDDLESALISAALEGLRTFEDLDGVCYDERTGLAVGDLNEEAFNGS